jgi:hypothetical protein
MAKTLTFDNGEVSDDCDHDIVDRPGANLVCRKCGTVNPEEDA